MWNLYQGNRSGKDAEEFQRLLQQGFERSDPFAEQRQQAGAQYRQFLKDPASYFNSPLARLQIEEMNRAVRAKQAGMGQTWNIDEMGNVRGSGTGATDFAKNLQTNLAAQYETMLGNRAQQAGMQLFPSSQMLTAQGGAFGMQQQARNQTGAGMGLLASSASRLFPEIEQGFNSGVEGIRRGIFGA